MEDLEEALVEVDMMGVESERVILPCGRRKKGSNDTLLTPFAAGIESERCPAKNLFLET